MTVNVLMPALSPTMEQGKLAKWLKSEGDAVKAGDVIAEIETDKATMEVEAVDEGVLARILVPGGTENVAVNTPIAVIAEEGESVADTADHAPIARVGEEDKAQKQAEAAPPAPARRRLRISPETPIERRPKPRSTPRRLRPRRRASPSSRRRASRRRSRKERR